MPDAGCTLFGKHRDKIAVTVKVRAEEWDWGPKTLSPTVLGSLP